MEKISRQKTARGFKASPERARAPSFGGTEQTHSAGCDAPSENLGHHGASPMPRITLRAPTTRRSQLCGRTDRLRCISHQSFRVRGYFCCVLASPRDRLCPRPASVTRTRPRPFLRTPLTDVPRIPSTGVQVLGRRQLGLRLRVQLQLLRLRLRFRFGFFLLLFLVFLLLGFGCGPVQVPPGRLLGRLGLGRGARRSIRQGQEVHRAEADGGRGGQQVEDQRLAHHHNPLR